MNTPAPSLWYHSKRLLASRFLISVLGVALVVAILSLAPTAHRLILGACVYAVIISLVLINAFNGPKVQGGFLVLFLLIILNLGSVNPLMFLENYGEEAFIYFRVLGFCQGLPLLVYCFTLYVCKVASEHRQVYILRLANWGLGGVTVAVGVMTGLLNQNYWAYLLGDAYKFLLPLALYLIITTSLEPDQTGPVFFVLALCSLTHALMGLGLHTYNLLSGFGIQRFGSHAAFAMTYFTFQAVYSPNRRFRRWCYLAICIAALEILSSLSRVTWMQMILLHAGLLIFVPWRLAFAHLLRVLVLVLALAIPSLSLVSDQVNIPLLIFGRAEELFIGDEEHGSRSGHLKVAEVKSVMEVMKELNLLGWVVGTGFGREYELAETDEGYNIIYGFRNERVHNIHNTPIAVLFRSGVLGLGCFSMVVGLTVYFSVKWFRLAKARGEPLGLALTAVIFLVLTCLKSLSVTQIVGDLYWGILAGFVSLNLGRGLAGSDPRVMTARKPSPRIHAS